MARVKRRPFQSLRLEWQHEDQVHHHLILPRLPDFTQLLFQLFGVLEFVDQVEPVPFHSADGTPGAAEQLGVAVVEGIEIAPQLFPCGRRTAARHPEQGRVRWRGFFIIERRCRLPL